MSQSDTAPGNPLLIRALPFLITAVLVAYSIATVWTSLTGAMEHYTIHVTLIFALVLSELIRNCYMTQRGMPCSPWRCWSERASAK